MYCCKPETVSVTSEPELVQLEDILLSEQLVDVPAYSVYCRVSPLESVDLAATVIEFPVLLLYVTDALVGATFDTSVVTDFADDVVVSFPALSVTFSFI